MSKILYKVVKRAFDLVFASILWLILSPFVIVIAILIKITSKGPIFVPNCTRLYRFGPFFMYKFRTMYVNGDSLLKANPELKEILESDHKIPIDTDPRVTWIGRFLRSLDLDEVPQLINVILGNMSLVGPRPYMIWEIEKLIKEGSDIERENMREIQEVKPGLTGLWQISGRNDLTFKQRVEIEAMYARNRNLLLDLRIFLRTPKILLTGKGRK
jgi:undecaprenyl-phosphate galactose phosphotransferase